MCVAYGIYRGAGPIAIFRGKWHTKGKSGKPVPMHLSEVIKSWEGVGIQMDTGMGRATCVPRATLAGGSYGPFSEP